jgi:RsiW-degrading membrane proteinase PrsW (M82 family)
MGVCESVDVLMGFLALIFLAVAIITTLCFFYNKDCGDEDMCGLLKKFIKPSIILVVVFMLLACAIPSKETCEEMMIASVVTHENVNQAKDDVKGIVDYVFDRIENDSESE